MPKQRQSLALRWRTKSVCLAMSFFLLSTGIVAAAETPVAESELFRLVTDQRMIFGVVEDIRSQEIRVNIGDLMPRFLSLKQAKDKDRPVPRVGDVLVLVINNQNNVLEYHLYGEENWHVLMQGSLVKPLSEDQTWALIKDPSGTINIMPIDRDARIKFAALPVGKDATFLVDATHSIIDVNWGS